MFQAAWTSFCVSFVTGSPGSGKSYTLVKDLHERLGEFRGKVITNLPIDVDAFSESVAADFSRDPEEVKEQIILLPQEVLKTWRDGDCTPGELALYPQRIGLETVEGCLLILDEVHVFCPKRNRNRQTLWEQWLGEVRHEGWAGIFFVSQDERKVGVAIQEHAELRFELSKADRHSDLVTGIQQYYWWELVASFTGRYFAFIQVSQFARNEGKLRILAKAMVRLEPKYFSLYRSLEAAGGGTASGSLVSKQLEYQRRGRLWFVVGEDGSRLAPVWMWVIFRNTFPITLRVMLFVFISWATFGGGIMATLMGFVHGVRDTVEEGFANGGMQPSPESIAEYGDEQGAPSPEANSVSTPTMQSAITDQPTEAFTEASAVRLAGVLQKLDGPEREEVLRQVQAMRQAFETERNLLRSAQYEEHLRKQKLKEVVKVVAVDRTRAWLSDGTEVYDGELVHGGLFDGLQVAEVNRARRFVRFNDGYVVAMSQPNRMPGFEGDANGESDKKPEADTGGSGQASIQGPVRDSSPGRVPEGP